MFLVTGWSNDFIIYLYVCDINFALAEKQIYSHWNSVGRAN